MSHVVKVHELSKKLILIILKESYKVFDRRRFDFWDLNDDVLKKMGLKTNLNLDTTFIYEAIKLNEESLKNKTITTENLIIPELKDIEILYYETRSEVITYYYKFPAESYSTDPKILDNYFSYDGDDYIEPSYSDPYDKEYGDGDTLETGISDVS